MTPEEIVRTYYQYFNERRLDEAGELVDPQASFQYLPTRQRLLGRAGYRALVAAWLNAFEDAVLDIVAITTDPRGNVVLDFVGRGTHTGDLVLGESFVIPASHKRAQLEFRDTLNIRDGLIVRSELDFDVERLRKQLLGEG